MVRHQVTHRIWRVEIYRQLAQRQPLLNLIIQLWDFLVRQLKHRRRISQEREIVCQVNEFKLYVDFVTDDFSFRSVLPDSTATDLDQHLSSLVGTPPSTAQMTHQSLMNSGGVNGNNTNHTTNGATNNLIVTRYNQNQGNNDYNLHSSQNGPRSLSDSSQAESPVQDDLLTSNTPNLGGVNGNQNFQNQNSYGNGGNGCNGSIYPVLPASLLYTQLYTAANQSHGFHSHSLQSHSSQNSLMHGELQSVMDHIVTGTGHGGRQQHQQLMAGNTDLSLIGNCGTAARVADENAARQLLGPRGQQPQHAPPGADNAAVWRPY
jgi:runt-related transcription factor